MKLVRAGLQYLSANHAVVHHSFVHTQSGLLHIAVDQQCMFARLGAIVAIMCTMSSL